MAVQIQALAFDSQQLSQNIQDQANQAILTNTILTVALLSSFAAFFLTIYFVAYRGTARSISKLKNGISVIGSGNLDYTVNAGKKDEIADISKSINQMTFNLKTVTASKTDLEKQIEERKKAEAQIEEQLHKFDLAHVIVKNMKDEIIFWNSGVEKMYGFSKDEAMGKIPRELLKTEFPKPIEQIKEELLLTGRWEGELVHTKADGSQIVVASTWVLHRDVDNKPSAIIETNNDITERKKAEQAVIKQAELIDLTPDAIIVTNLNDAITLWNKGAEKMYGWTSDEAIGKDIHDLLESKFPHSLKEVLEQIRREGKWSGELTQKDKNRDKLVVQSSWLGKLGKDGKLAEILESNVDITERIQMQAKLEESAVLVEEYANQMEDLANQRAEQLKNAERLATIGATAGMVGHDIRNPLQAITGDVYLAKVDLASIPESDEKNNVQESLTEIERNVDYINKIVADLQDFARPLNPKAEETDLKLVINDLLSKNGLPENIEVSVRVETDAQIVVADSTFVNRIMYNLVTNAVQAMPKGGKLIIRSHKEANAVILTVKDTGVGIPENVKSKLFTPMFTTKAKGQGFGLAVIKRMTESLGGTVTFESQEGKGTTFIIKIPSETQKAVS